MAFEWSFGTVSEGGAGDAPAPTGAQLRPGSVFAERFRIVSVLGQGGMGRVLCAHDREAGRDVAIKVMLNSLQPRQILRFLREGQLTATLRHPGLVTVHGGGVTQDGRAFLVLELIEGAREFAAPNGERTDSLRQLVAVGQALGHAHAQGIVHRDLKPSNVLIDAQGRVRVCDFGLAWGEGLDRLTQTGALLGTPAYMPPERFESAKTPPQPAEDVWSLGVMLYEVLCGQHPFTAEHGALTLMALVNAGNPPAPRQINPETSLALEAVCLRALAREPGARFPDGAAFADALQAALDAPPPSRGRLAALLGAASLVAAISVAVGALTLSQSPPPTPLLAPAEAHAPNADPTPASEEERRAERLVSARETLERALVLAHEPTRFRPIVAAEFGVARLLAADDPELRERIERERLGYLFRRGHWGQVLEEAETRAGLRGESGAQAAFLQALVHYERLQKDATLEVCRRRWALSEGRERTLTDQVIGAWARLLEDDPEGAVDQLSAVLAEEPQHVPALLILTSARGIQLKLDRVERLLKTLAVVAPDHPTAFRWGISAAIHHQDYQRASTLSARLLAILEPAPPIPALHAHAKIQFNLRNVLAARETYARILEQDPGDPGAEFFTCLLILREGDEPQALRRLRALRAGAPEAFAQHLSTLDPIRLREDLRRKLGPP